MRFALVVAATSLLAGCASVNPRPGFEDVRKTVADRSTAQPEWSRTPSETSGAEQAVAKLLAEPLTANGAVQVAFLNNPTLQATIEEIGISQADLAQAARVANPEVSGFVRFPSEGSGRNTEFSLVLNIFDVFIQPLRKKVAAAELEQTKLRVASEVLSVAAEVKEAFFTLQARQQLVERMSLIRDVTETAGELCSPELRAAFRKSIEFKLDNYWQNNQKGFMSFGLVQLGQAATSPGDEELAYRCLTQLVNRYWLNNLASMHNHRSLFNMDISGGMPSVIIKMLVASDPGRLQLLPALPKAWPTGTIEGVLCRGQIEVRRLHWNPDGLECTLRSVKAHGLA